MILIDLARTVVSLRAAGRYKSAALQASAFHFGTDLLGSTAVLVGLVLARAGYRDADSFAALFVAVLVFAAAFRLMRRNVDVLMDRAPADALEAARQAIEADVHVVGVNSLAAGHLALVPALRDELAAQGRPDILIIAGGVIPPQDHPALREAGASAIFPPGTVIADSAVELVTKLGESLGHDLSAAAG